MTKKGKLLSVFLFLLLGIAPTFAKKTTNTISKAPVVTHQQLPEKEQRLFDYYFYEAMKAKSSDKYAELFDYLNYCFKLDSTNANILFELGNVYNSLENKSKALAFYQKASYYDNTNFYYNLALGSTYLELQQYTEAIPIYEALIKQNPDKIELNLYLSEAYRLEGNLPKAIEALNNVERLIGLNEKISLQKFQLYSTLDDKKKAYAEVQKYIDEYPTDIKYYILLGNLYMQDNKTKDALACYTKARAIDADDPYLITSMANYYEQVNDKAAAEKELYNALFNPKIEVETKLGILAQYVGTLQQNDKGTERANALLDTLMVTHPQESRLNLMYGNLLLSQDKKQDARFQFQIYAESNPTNAIGWEQLLKTAYPDSLELSIDICKKAISYIPDHPLFYLYLGAAQYMSEDYTSALKTLKTGFDVVDPQNPYLQSEFCGQIGDLYHKLNNLDSAFVFYEKAIKFNPQNMTVLNNYSYFLSLQRKDLDRAEKMSSITVKAEPTNATFLDTYGWILFEQGAYTMAKIYIENAVKHSEAEKDGASWEVLEHYGDILYKTDEKEKALEYWIKAKEKGGDSKTLDKKIKTGEYVAE